MSVRRLESEAVRDSILAVSGVLSSEMDGPPVPVKEDGGGQIVLGREMLDGERKPTGADPDLPGATRRSIYVQVRLTRCPLCSAIYQEPVLGSSRRYRQVAAHRMPQSRSAGCRLNQPAERDRQKDVW